MPLIVKKKMGKFVQLLLWRIDESIDELTDQLPMHPSDALKYSTLRNRKKQQEFLALRQCLNSYFHELPEVFYMDNGKPFLKNGYQLSMSHSFPYAAVILSPCLKVGIDLENYRPSFERVAPKFMSELEKRSLRDESHIHQLIHFWGAKEVMVKITGNRRYSFKQQLHVAPFIYKEQQQTCGVILEGEHPRKVQLYFETLEDVHLSYGWLC